MSILAFRCAAFGFVRARPLCYNGPTSPGLPRFSRPPLRRGTPLFLRDTTPVPGQAVQPRQRVLAKRFTTAGFVKDSTVISALSFLGVAGAFLLDAVVAARYGLGVQTDAFYVAVGVPQLIWSILSSSATRVLTPVFTESLEEKGEAETWLLFSILGNASLVALPAIGCAGALLSPVIVRIAGAGLQEPGLSLAITMNRILFLMLIPAGLIQVMRAVLNAHTHFSAPAATTFLHYGIIVAAVLLLDNVLGITAVSVGYILGMIGQVMLLVVVIWFKGGHYTLSLDFDRPEVRKTARLLVPPLGAEVLGQSTTVIERALASFLPPGSVTALALAGRILRALDVTFLNNVAVAILPRLSSLATAKDLPGLKRLLSLGLRVTWAMTIPLTAVFFALDVPIVRLLFQRGAFNLQAASLTATVLSLYIVGLPLLAMLRLLMSTFYSMQDTTTPFFVRAGMLGFNLAGDLVLMTFLGVSGLALATSLTYLTSSLAAAWLLRRKIGPLDLRINRYLAKTCVAAFIMTLAALVARAWLEQRMHVLTLAHLVLEIGLVLGVAALAYLAAVFLLRIEEFQRMLGWVRDRLGARRIGHKRQC